MREGRGTGDGGRGVCAGYVVGGGMRGDGKRGGLWKTAVASTVDEFSPHGGVCVYGRGGGVETKVIGVGGGGLVVYG